MIQSYEQGESNLFIEESSANMPALIISLLLRNVEEKLTSKPDDVRLQFLAAKLADVNGDNDLAKQHWLAVKINASKDSDEYKQAVLRLKALTPSHRSLIFVIVAILIIIGGSIGFYFFRKKKQAEFKEIPNPYITGKAISDKNMFFGREDIFSFVKDKLSRSVKDGIVLYGGRRTGKTSILNQIANGRLGDEFVPVFIDMQEMAGVDTHGFFRSIAQKVIEALKIWINLSPEDQKNLNELCQKFDDKTISFDQSFNDLINYVIPKLEGKYLIFLVDEYEILSTKVSNGDLTDNIFPYLRSLMQKLIFIYSGSRNIEGRDTQEWNVMLNIVPTKEVSFLNREDAIALITKPVEGFLKYDKKAIERLLRLTVGQPFFTQNICSHIVDNSNDRKQNRVRVEDVDIACHNLVDSPPYHLAFVWEGLNSNEKIVIALLAEFIQDAESYASIDDIMLRMEKYSLQLDRSDIGKALGLEKDDLIEKKANDEFYRFRMDFSRIWIQSEHQTWGVLREVQDNK